MTVKELCDIIQSKLEDEATPELVLDWAKKLQGKAIRANNIPEGFELYKNYGMTFLETKGYRCRKEGDWSGFSFLIAWTEKGAIVPEPDKFQERNAQYYRGRIERNAERRAMLADPAKLFKLADLITRAENAKEEYITAFCDLKRATAYHGEDSLDYHAESNDFEKLVAIPKEL